MIDYEVDALVGFKRHDHCKTKEHYNWKRNASLVSEVRELQGSARLKIWPFYRFYELCIALSYKGERSCPLRSDYWYHRAGVAELQLASQLLRLKEK